MLLSLPHETNQLLFLLQSIYFTSLSCPSSRFTQLKTLSEKSYMLIVESKLDIPNKGNQEQKDIQLIDLECSSPI